ncbi:MAG: biotin--[acetyl-CoA-carboxylase] ligase [Muribaculaceae bacterium]|nr:biotin--[acetyl-CoA-carboxylase] ligase [Muribaculaceae bacterium]
MGVAIVTLDECASTNTVLASMAEAVSGTVVATRRQTAGRGQRGNSWESEPGKNLTFSQLIMPRMLPAARQFELSMIVSLAIADAIDAHLPDGVRTCVKWPNDIYIGREKVCGILIENRLAGSRIERAIVGVGINVNQRVFVSDAPNPTSIIHHNGGVETGLGALLTEVSVLIDSRMAAYESSPEPEALKAAYMSRLMRRSGQHLFSDAEHGTFEACISDVDFDGTLTLSNGCRYAFKEVTFII